MLFQYFRFLGNTKFQFKIRVIYLLLISGTLDSMFFYPHFEQWNKCEVFSLHIKPMFIILDTRCDRNVDIVWSTFSFKCSPIITLSVNVGIHELRLDLGDNYFQNPKSC